MSALLSARGVVKSYGRTRALRGVTLAVEAGEIAAVTGPSGCGKSTLLHCLAGILRPLAGEHVLGHLVRLAREQETTVLLVTHDARVAGYADREIALRDGRLDPTGLGLAA